MFDFQLRAPRSFRYCALLQDITLSENCGLKDEDKLCPKPTVVNLLSRSLTNRSMRSISSIGGSKMSCS